MKGFTMTIGEDFYSGTSVLEQIAETFNRLFLKVPKPDPKDGKAIGQIIEKLSPKEAKDADRSRKQADLNPAK